jgi:hypothetical protein
MRYHPHKDPGKPHDDPIEKTGDLFADPVPSIEPAEFGRRLAQIIYSGLQAAKRAAQTFPKEVSAIDQARRPELRLRRTGLSPPIYRDQLDYEVVQDGRVVGRIYEDPHTLPELRWFWSITAFVGYQPDIVTNGRAPTLELAKARFFKNWQKCRTDHSTQSGCRSI